ncbi:alpha/beta fold hydrolase [Mariniflexile ostreae]|uniref:Alpha/beta fold hydrolase n=1 Tax=Mariniflexile ostreae TaxID=1520892 RepID=A0ABV5F8L1_9FLAO
MLPKIIGFFLNILSVFSSEKAAKIALKLFSVPRKGQITPEQSLFLKSGSTEVLFYKNNSIMTYRWAGHKSTVLLVHGWESNAGRWMDIILGLQKKGFNIIALDAPAHGKSGSKIFNVALYATYIKVVSQHFNPHIIIAHSMGGMASVFSIWQHHIKNIKKLVLLGAPCHYTDVVARYIKMMGYNKRIATELDKTITKCLGFPPEAFSTSKNLKNNRTQGLVIHDKNDDSIPFPDALLIKKSLKNSTLIVTRGLGHSLQDESVSLQIQEFINH